MKKNVAIVYGGYSSEAVVSEKSLAGLLTFIDAERYNLIPVFISKEEWSAVVNGNHMAIDRSDFSFVENGVKKNIDFAYITIHGAPGENGQLTGYFEMIGLPHSTCPSLTSAMTYDKFVCNSYLRSLGVKVADSVIVKKGRSYDSKAIAERLGLPCFVKPSAAGSSFGVSKVKTIDEITPAVEKAFSECSDVVIESFLDGTEVTCGLYKTKERTVIFPLTEVVSSNEFFDYEAKYTPGKTQEITPARVPDEERDRVQQIASEVYDLMNMKGIARIDFIIMKGQPYLLEVNTTPGMTATSFIPQQIKASGAKLSDVFTEVIEDILETK
ncbi:MAG: D-alanine--D-alanine ligase [Bacteroidales bacterium]|nr:D-alanine--D-alanine ligase [Bacteroidales bacterium]